MTSKEIIQEVIKELEWCKKEDTMYEAETNLLLPDMEQVLKDLEILEILKKRLNIKIPYGSVNVISANNDDDYLLFKVELKEHTKIEEWLDGKD